MARIVDFSHSGVLFPGERLLLNSKFSLCDFVVVESSRNRNPCLSVPKTVAIINDTLTILVPSYNTRPKAALSSNMTVK